MAHPGKRSDSSGETESPGLLAEGSPQERASDRLQPALPLVCGLTVLAGLASVYATERVTLLPALAVLAATAGLVLTWPAVRSRPAAAGAVLLNAALVLLYFWSLDEAHHVVVQISPGKIVARVDGDAIPLSFTPTGAVFGFQQGSYESYRMQATGEAVQTDLGTWMGRLGQALRMAEPGPAWTNIRIQGPNGKGYTPVAPIATGSGAWSKNRRGEWEGSPGSYVLFPAQSAPSYMLSADLVRPDGAQDLLLGVDKTGTGLALQIRVDQPDALWIRWHAGMVGGALGSTYLQHLAVIPDIQRDLRLVLTGYLFALVFLALAAGGYPIILTLFRLVDEPGSDEWTAAKQLMQDDRFCWGFFALVSLAGVILTGIVSTYLLDRMPHVQDSVAYLYQAKILAMGRFNVPAPPLPIQSFLSEEYMPFYQGKWFSQYPPGHPLMLTIGVLLGASWLVEPALAALALGGIYLLGRRVYGNGTGVLAAVLGLLSPFWLFLGSEFMSHPTGLFFIVGFMICFAYLEDGNAPLYLALAAGFLAGMAFITRQLTVVGTLAPFGIYALYWARLSWRSYVAAIAGFAVPVSFLLVYNRVQMGSPFLSTYAAWSPHYRLGFGPDKPPFGDFTLGDGFSNTWQNLSMLSLHLFGWPYAVSFAFMLIPFILGTARKWDYLLLASFIGLVVCYVFYWCPCLMYGPRFYYEGLAPLLLLTARGVFELGRLPSRIWPHLPHDRPLGALIPVLLLVSLTVYNLRFYLPAQIPLYRGYNYSSGAELRTVEQAHIHHAIVFVAPQMAWFWAGYGNVFFANDPLLRGDIIYVRDLGSQDSNLYPFFPGRSHYRLVESPAVGGKWTLTRIS